MRCEKDFYYRYDFNHFEPHHPFLSRFIKVRDTPKGVVVINECMEGVYFHSRRSKNTKENREYKRSLERFILNSSVKKFCYKTKYEALFGFIKRQESRSHLLQSQLNMVNDFLDFSNVSENLLDILNEYNGRIDMREIENDVNKIKELLSIHQ